MLVLAKGLAKRNLDVRLVLSKAEGAHVRDARASLDLVDLGTRSNPRAIPRLIHYIKDTRPDVMVAALEHANVAALAAKRLSGVNLRLAITTHTMVSMALRSSPRVTSRMIVPLMRILYPTANIMVAVSQAVAEDLASVAKLPLNTIQVIHNAVVSHDVITQSQAPVNCSWFDPGAPPVVISAGSLWRHKGHDTLVQAVSIARRQRPIRLIILGEGPERANLIRLTKSLDMESNVLMPGFVPNPYPWIRRSKVFVLPSRWEGLGNALIEAMALGVTSVATDCPGGPREILDGGRFGMLTPPEDSRALAEAILKSLDEPVDPEYLQRRAKSFHVDEAVERYLKLVVNPTAA